MRAVNLMPRDTQDARSRRGALPVLAAVALLAAVTAVAGVLAMQASAQADGYEADLALTEAALARLPKPAPEPAPSAPDVSAERSNRVAALQSALATRVPVDELLTDLSYVVPDDVWLTGFSLSAPSEAGVATITIEGATYSQPSTARFLARLSTLSSLDKPRLTKSERVVSQAAAGGANQKRPKTKPKAVITFTVTADAAGGMRS